MESFRDTLIEYLELEKKFSEEDIEKNKSLTEVEKEEAGLIIRNAKVVKAKGSEYELSVDINNTKLRPGDRVIIKSHESNKVFHAKIIENGFERIDITCVAELDDTLFYTIEIIEKVMLEPIINLLKGIEAGMPGSVYLEMLAGLGNGPKIKGLGSIRYEDVEDLFPKHFNKEQLEACKYAIQRPSLYCIQGPPGTGKTDVLSRIASVFCYKEKSILVISNTHQAVNNALNKIAKNVPDATVVKVGEALKAEGLVDSIITVKTYSEYSKNKKSKNNTSTYEIIGMTLYGGVLNFGLKNSDFNPTIVLVDEAGQIPLAQAACIGAFGCGSVIFIGDDKQMPPIYHQLMVNNPISVSIFNYLCILYPSFKIRLRITYRMNKEITEVISRNFYEKDGEALVSSDFSKDRKLILNNNSSNEAIHNILLSPSSLIYYNASTDNYCEDMNVEEAVFIADLIKEAIKSGMLINDIAVITPYRRQV